jgi:nucleotide-binding universal stress UspA family protein
MPYSHLLVPSDGSDRSQRAVREAVRLAVALGARITVLTVEQQPRMPVPGMGERLDGATLATLASAAREESERVLAEALAIAAAAGVAATVERISGERPHQAIVAAADRLGCDLIVMASHGRRGFQRMLLGSQTQRVLVQASMPVLVTR